MFKLKALTNFLLFLSVQVKIFQSVNFISMAFLPTPPHKHIKDPAIVQFMDTFQDDIYVLADYPPPYTQNPAIVQFMSTLQDDIYVLASFNKTKYPC